MSLLHTVLFRFDPELPADDVDEMYGQVRAWPDAIGGFEHLAIGSPLSAVRTQGYQYLLHIVVADEDALERYQIHPVHQRFAAWVRDHGGLVLAFDYVLDRDSVVSDEGAIGDRAPGPTTLGPSSP